MKVIFLDVDGVLNSEETCEHWHEITQGGNGFGGFFREEDAITISDTKWGESLVGRVRKIVEATGANIVISSTWRRHFSIEKFKEMFKLYGWDVPVIGMTPKLSGGRGVEINAWLKNNPVESYVIIDDVDQFLIEQRPYYVETNMMVGITEDDVTKAINILSKPKQ
jgi:hypothetical protein